MRSTDNLDLIVKQAIKHNRMAQHEIYNRFHREMLGLSIRMVGQTDQAEDLLQEAFIKAFTNLKKLKDPKRFPGWFKQIVVNECIAHIKRAKYFTPLDDERAQVESREADEDEDEWFCSISFEEINREVDRLPQGCRQIFTLYLIENYKQREIAKMLDLSLSTVKSQYKYALKLLRLQLKR